MCIVRNAFAHCPHDQSFGNLLGDREFHLFLFQNHTFEFFVGGFRDIFFEVIQGEYVLTKYLGKLMLLRFCLIVSTVVKGHFIAGLLQV